MKKISTKVKTQEKNKMSEIDDQILKYFDIKKRLGKGAYGVVWKSIDKKTNNVVAIKKIFDAFRNETDAQRTFREIMFLRAFRSHPNVIQLFSIHKATNNLDIYLAFEFMESDLHNVIKRGTILKDIHKRYVMYQLFNAVKYIHSGNVIHRDLKPSNVLIDSKCRCKIADFGLARSVSNRPTGDTNTSVDPTEPILTDYVATRWYRAPEILIASKKYTKGIDMWSLGCILGEMIRGKPLFPGSSTVNQIEKIIASLPEVTDQDIAAIGTGFGSVLLNQQINLNGNPTIEDLLNGAPDDAKQLVKALLVLDPNGRFTAKEALAHKYIEKFRHSISEAELNSDVLPPFRDDVQLTVPEYRSKLYEIMHQATEKEQVTNLKLNHSAKQFSVRKKEVTPTNIKKSHSINSAASVNKRISPLKNDDKLKHREYQYLKYTEMRQQQQQQITPKCNQSQLLPQNINNNINQNNNNQNLNGSYQNTNNNSNNSNNNNIPSSSSSSSTSNKTGHQQQQQQQQQQHHHKTNNSSYKIVSQQNLNDNTKLQQSIGTTKLKYCKISTTLPSDTNNNKYTNLVNSDIITDNQKIGNYQNKITSIKHNNIIEKRHSIDCTFNNNNNNNNVTNTNNSNVMIPQPSSASLLNTNQQQQYNIIGKSNINYNTSLNQINHNTIKYQSKYSNNITNSNNNVKQNTEELLQSPTISTTVATRKLSSNNNNSNKLNRKNNLSPPDNELVNRFKLKKIDVLQMLPNNTNDQTDYYEKRLKNLEDKINKHKMDIKEFFQDNQKLHHLKTDNNLIKLNKFPINNSNNNNNFNNINNNSNNNINNNSNNGQNLSSSALPNEKLLRNKISLIREKFEGNNNMSSSNNCSLQQKQLLTSNQSKQGSFFSNKYHSYPGEGDGHNLINGKRKEYSSLGATKQNLDIRKSQVIS